MHWILRIQYELYSTKSPTYVLLLRRLRRRSFLRLCQRSDFKSYIFMSGRYIFQTIFAGIVYINIFSNIRHIFSNIRHVHILYDTFLLYSCLPSANALRSFSMRCECCVQRTQRRGFLHLLARLHRRSIRGLSTRVRAEFRLRSHESLHQQQMQRPVHWCLRN